ncbi:zinc finger protein 362-like [Scylla paramamosain]|uniref:zinc finger protein 362-like n=1 Tax=Scylla paramamosain TaxID=85552 RepID=UPI00308275C6
MGVLKGKYARCPLKKRPLSLDYEEPAEGGVDEQTEPEDLSIRCGNEAPPTPLPQSPHTRVQNTRSPDKLQQSAGTDARDGRCPGQGRSVRMEATCSVDLVTQAPQDTRQEGNASVRRSTPPPSTPAPPDSHCMAKLASPGPGAESQHVRAMQALATRLDVRPSATPVSSGDGHLDTTKPGEYSPHSDPRDTVRLQQLSPSSGLASRAPLVPGWDTSRIDGGGFGQAVGPAGPLGTRPQGFPEVTEANRAPEHNLSPVSASRPHRPWLTDDPPRQNVLRAFPSVPTLPPPERQRHLIAASNLWNGMVPLTWPLPHMLPPNPPPLPGRQSRECGSPGSESASSEGSSGGGRGDARYSCTDCGKSYSTYSGLSKHKQFHCAALGAKSFACKHCEKVYTSLGALKMHIRTHTLPCKCQLCGKAFSRPWLLQGHIRTHTGEKPFQCPQCDRCFADRSNLRAHLQTHADVKKYACGTCHKTFSRMSLLNKHTEAACPAMHRPSHP